MPEQVSGVLNRRGVLKHVATGAVSLGVSGNVVAKGNNTGSGNGEYIIGTGTEEAAAKAENKADTVHRRLDFGSIGKAVVGRFPEAARANLQNRPDVRYVEADDQMQAIGETVPWGVDRVDADVVHNDGYTGAGADIAILDTGIDSDHADLEANLGSGKSFVACDSGCTSNSCHQSWDDDNGHGTHCAGIANAVNNSSDVVGVSTEATLHALKVLGCDGYGSYSDIAAGINHATDQGWDVASMSIGGGSSSSTLQDACQYAADNGTLVVAAAGNSGPCSDCVMYPAKYDSTIAVSATDSNDGLASFSSTGPEIDIAAPGVSILSTVPGGTATYSGTSMACPHVSGAAGVLMAEGKSNTEARQALAETAEDIGLSGNEQGNGLLDVEAAITGTQNMIGEA
ncbi:MAG: S8 family peptidase, partial [Halolamina sp.]